MDANAVMEALNTPEGRRNPYPLYAELHQLGAACAVTAGRYPVVVHGYDAVNQVLRDPAYRVIDAVLLDKSGSKWREHLSQKTLLITMFFMNDAEHTRLRGAFSRAVTPRRVHQLREKIDSIVDDLMDQLAAHEGKTVDFMAEFAFPLPGNVICELMGVPLEDRAWFMPRAHIFGDLLDLGAASPEKMAEGDAATLELIEYFADLVARRRTDPQDDLITDVAQSSMDDETLYASLLSFFNAGYASTSHLIGKGIPILLAHPEVVAWMSQGDKEADQCVSELLRYEPPGHFVVRYTEEQREIDGVDVPPGTRVLVLIGAANHDPIRFPDPQRFDPYRTDNRPVAFGAGLHFCLGAPLSQLEGVVAFPKLFKRFPGMQLAGDPVTTDRLTQHGYHSLPLTI